MIDAVIVGLMVFVVGTAIYAFRYYWNAGNSPGQITTMGSKPTDPVETILRGDFAAQTPELEKPLAVQKAFGTIILAAMVLLLLIRSLIKMHAH